MNFPDLLQSGKNLTTRHRTTHTYVIGQSGTGKSRAMESWIMQDILHGNGVAVIDPHGDLFNHLLYRMATRIRLWRKVVLINPLDPEWIVRFNPLDSIRGYSPERMALYLTDVVVKIWKLSPTNAPRMVWLLTNSFLALSDLGLSLLDLPRFLLDCAYRETQLQRMSIPMAQSYFQYEFPSSDSAIHQWVTPVLNKIGGLVFDPDIRLMFAGKSTINFRQILDRQLILLVNLPKGILGEEISNLLAAFIVAHIQKAALSRADTLTRSPFYLYLDEFQSYTTDNITDILSESRKYALSLIMAHQYLDQLSGELRSAVLNTAGTLVSFRVGYHDAQRLVKEVFPSPDFLNHWKMKIQLNQTGSLPIPTLKNQRMPSGWEHLVLELAKLKPRQFWLRRRGPYKPIKQFSFDMPDIKLDDGLKASIKALLNYSGEQFGTPKGPAQRAYQQTSGRHPNNRVDPPYDDQNIPDWSF